MDGIEIPDFVRAILPDREDEPDVLGEGRDAAGGRSAKGADPRNGPGGVGPVGPSGPPCRVAANGAGSEATPAGADGGRNAGPDPVVGVDPITPQQRPTWRLHRERWRWSDDPEGRSRPPGLWWHGLRERRRGEAVPVDRRLCAPLEVSALARDPSDDSFVLVLEFRDLDGHHRRLTVRRSELAGDARELERRLLGAGLDLEPGAFPQLRAWLQRARPRQRYRIAAQTGWTEDGRAFVLPDLTIGADDVLLDDGVREGPRRCGDLGGWRESVALLEDNPLPAFAVLLALAAPLLRPVGRHSGGVHLFGPTTTGKTTMLKLAASVWGSPESYLRTWNATRNGLGAAAAACNDALLALDEIGEAKPEAVQEIVYHLGNDTGRSRADRDGSARALQRWKVALLSTGECPIREVIERSGRRMAPGAAVRLLDVPAEGRYGVFDELHGFADGAQFAEHLLAGVREHYGLAGPAFVRCVLEQAGVERVRILYKLSLGELKRSVESVTHRRGATLFALARTAGLLAVKAGILPWTGDFVDACCDTVFARWCEQAPRSPEEQVVENLRAYLDRYGASRFAPLTSDEKWSGGRERDGWYENREDEGRIWYFTTEGLRRATGGVVEVRQAARILRDHGLLVCREGGRLQAKKQIEDRRVRVYVVSFDSERSGRVRLEDPELGDVEWD